jgi:putative colanic acid biosynthesis glycosyltransferase
MKVLQINAAVNTGSTGRIAEGIGKVLMEKKHQSIIAYGRSSRASSSQTIKIGNTIDQKVHGIKSRFLDKHGFGSATATKLLTEKIEQLRPDIIHLHNLHGYYLHVGVLFQYLKKSGIPVVWTLHDCWAFTGHCCYFESVKCEKWKTECQQCPLYNRYPQSFFIDNSTDNFYKKKALFTSIKNLVLVTPSHWLRNLLAESFLNDLPARVIHNGIDLEQFTQTTSLEPAPEHTGGGGFIILGVASIWDRRKGLADFIQLAGIIDKGDKIILVGLTKKQMKGLPENVIGIERTESVKELAALYSSAAVFINPTWVDNFPTTNIEALASGTPVITYNTGGSVEAVDKNTGIIVQKGDVPGIKAAIDKVKKNGKDHYIGFCQKRAAALFNDKERFTEYIDLYKTMLAKTSVNN